MNLNSRVLNTPSDYGFSSKKQTQFRIDVSPPLGHQGSFIERGSNPLLFPVLLVNSSFATALVCSLRSEMISRRLSISNRCGSDLSIIRSTEKR